MHTAVGKDASGNASGKHLGVERDALLRGHRGAVRSLVGALACMDHEPQAARVLAWGLWRSKGDVPFGSVVVASCGLRGQRAMARRRFLVHPLQEMS